MSVTPRLKVQIVAFRDTLEVCNLVDLGFSGVPFTYDNKRHGAANVHVRLDRAVTTAAWRHLFAFLSVVHVASPCSDHVVLLLKGELDMGRTTARNCRYELFWERDEGLLDVIKDAWSSVGNVHNMAQLQEALNKTMDALQLWSKKSVIFQGNLQNHEHSWRS